MRLQAKQVVIVLGPRSQVLMAVGSGDEIGDRRVRWHQSLGQPGAGQMIQKRAGGGIGEQGRQTIGPAGLRQTENFRIEHDRKPLCDTETPELLSPFRLTR